MTIPKEGRAMATRDRIYFARRAAEEQELASTASDPQAADTHRRLQRAYLERASVGDRMPDQTEASVIADPQLREGA
jgi:hypothetical protein